MKTATAVLCAWMLAVTPLSAMAAAADPAAVAAGLAAHPPADLDAYYPLKQQLGDAGLMDVRSQTSAIARKQAGFADTGVFPLCSLPDWYLTTDPALALALDIKSDAEWTTVRPQISAALDQRAATLRQVMAGETPDPGYAGAAGAYKAAASATNPRLAEILRRVGQDQFDRISSQVLDRGALWGKGLTPPALAYVQGMNRYESCRTDKANTAWLKDDLKAHGWPKISVDGAAMDAQAWLLVQHADQDIDFQRYVLGLLKGLLATKDTSFRNYAYLYDRVAVADKRPERYGTQGHCTGPGKWEPFTVEDPANLDKRRAEAGLEPEAQYQLHFTYCTAEIAALEANIK